MPTQRLNYELPIDVQLPNGRIVHTRTHDIDNTGMTIKSPYNAVAGDIFKLHFSVLNGSTSHTLTAEAIANLSILVGDENLFHVHLRFKKLTPQQQHFLDTFINERKRG
ncbi:MAG: PilZ domain-containing protein [Methylococcaceae bacterium]|nr:MAG: PilZ domain-containing protein [Methylococcaceae bacterium]